jgi:TolA-binding protein
VLLLDSSSVAAKDRVVLQPREQSSPWVLSCDVVDYAADSISVRLGPQGDVRHFPADEVIAVEAVHTESHREGVRHFRDGNLSEAERLFTQALSEDPRGWVQREICGWLVKCAMRRGDRAQAGRQFLQIIEEERAPREYPLIPLVWGAAEGGTVLRQQARQWLTGESGASRLLGASVLLFDAAYAEITRSELLRLSGSSDPRVAALAEAQLWRLRVMAADVTEDELAGWEREIETLPRELRAGPYFVLGRACSQRSEYDRAAAAFLWLTAVYSANEPLTAQATVEAGRSLMRLGRLAEARGLFEEVARDFPGTAAAAEAGSFLNQQPLSPDPRRDG